MTGAGGNGAEFTGNSTNVSASNFTASSSATPLLARPFFNLNANREDVQLSAFPGISTGTVTALLAERPGLQRVEVDGEPAYVLTELIGPVAVGDRVVVNTTAVELGLGTGGLHFVVAVEGRGGGEAEPVGRTMKLVPKFSATPPIRKEGANRGFRTDAVS